ncbi:MAG: hypothetical protein F4138_04860 [Acidimicrobiia bacterium]|nr:hypothetical protein [Acidimicrobiia bacterium]
MNRLTTFLTVAIVLVLLLAMPVVAHDPAADIAARDRLIVEQEKLLNVYRCMFNIDIQLVPGGCVNSDPASLTSTAAKPANCTINRPNSGAYAVCRWQATPQFSWYNLITFTIQKALTAAHAHTTSPGTTEVFIDLRSAPLSCSESFPISYQFDNQNSESFWYQKDKQIPIWNQSNIQTLFPLPPADKFLGAYLDAKQLHIKTDSDNDCIQIEAIFDLGGQLRSVLGWLQSWEG